MAGSMLNVGTVTAPTVIVKVAFALQNPEGVNVYVVVALLVNAGDQLPEIPLSEVVGSGAKNSPEQIGATELKVGVSPVFTVTVKIAVDAHCPAVGVKV